MRLNQKLELNETNKYRNYFSNEKPIKETQTAKNLSTSFKGSFVETKDAKNGTPKTKESRKSTGMMSPQSQQTCFASLRRPSSSKQIRSEQKATPSESTKLSHKNNGLVCGYAANTNKGLVRGYNEDRVSIILNIMKPLNRVQENWPKCSFFGVYDGHGGVSCADFLRDSLHQFVIKEPSFPSNPKEALRQGFLNAENKFLEQAQIGDLDRSGSCAIVVLIVGDQCYVANVGDSRAVMSGSAGSKVYTLSRDHKPCDPEEAARIRQAGGKIYQSRVSQQVENGPAVQVLGPHRVMPGRLSVCRTFGDIEAKLPSHGGLGKVVICEPEIRQFQITDEHDFIILGSDGIFDKMTSKDCVNAAWDVIEDNDITDVHAACGLMVEGVMNESLRRKTYDNITVVAVALHGLKKTLASGNKENRTQPKILAHSSGKFKTNSINYSSFGSLRNNLPISPTQGNKLIPRSIV